ncbi:MAG: NAD-dependent epimerase/dehydratase family protein [Bacteroidota bacterium]
MTKKSVLVTGGAGFVGANLVKRLLDYEDFHIVVLDDLSGGVRENVPQNENISFVEGTIADVQLIKELFQKHQFFYVYHLAAYAAEGLSHFIRRFNYENNLIGSINLINESVNTGVKRFVFTSSIAVYGAGQVPMREDMAPQPEDPYGIAKYAVELDLKNAHEMFGLDYVIFRPHNVYGEYQNIGDKYRNVVGIFMNQILKDEPMTIFGDGEQKRAFSYVGDLLDPMITSAWLDAARNQIFNVGADVPYTVNFLAKKIGEAFGKPDYPVRHLDARNEVVEAYSSHSKAEKAFGKSNTTSLEQGLKKMASWVKDVGSRESSFFGNIEIPKNLPPSWVQ